MRAGELIVRWTYGEARLRQRGFTISGKLPYAYSTACLAEQLGGSRAPDLARTQQTCHKLLEMTFISRSNEPAQVTTSTRKYF